MRRIAGAADGWGTRLSGNIVQAERGRPDCIQTARWGDLRFSSPALLGDKALVFSGGDSSATLFKSNVHAA